MQASVYVGLYIMPYPGEKINSKEGLNMNKSDPQDFFTEAILCQNIDVLYVDTYMTMK